MNNKRHLKIIKIIKDEVIKTQEELVERLHQSGIDVTQATISRDIKKLGLIKIPDGYGNYKYSLPDERNYGDRLNWLRKMFQDFVIDIDFSENLIVIKTLPGTAMGLASAIDSINWKEIIGSVAGDDNLILIIKPKERMIDIFEKLQTLLG